jgi:hypothetical protein
MYTNETSPFPADLYNAIVSSNYSQFVVLLGNTDEEKESHIMSEYTDPDQILDTITPLTLAARYTRYNMLKYMLNYITIYTDHDAQAIYNAVSTCLDAFINSVDVHNATQCLRLLLADTDDLVEMYERANDGNVRWDSLLLSRAMEDERYYRAVRLLLDHYNLNTCYVNDNHNTALLMAIEHNQPVYVRYVIARVDTFWTNGDGQTPIAHLVRERFGEVGLQCARQLLNQRIIRQHARDWMIVDDDYLLTALLVHGVV